MKLTIEQSALQKGLARVVAVVAARNTIPILSNVLIDAESEPDRVWITATDLDREARTAVEATIEEAGRITAPASLLSDIARNAPSGAEIAMIWEKTSEPRLQVKFGRSNYKVPVLPAGDFPVWGERKWPITVTVTTTALSTLIERSAFVADGGEKGNVRPLLSSAYLHPLTGEVGRRLRMVATNGHRLAWADELEFDGPDDWKGVIIPVQTLQEFSRALAGRVAAAQLHISETGIQLDVADMVISSKLVEGEYLDYRRAVPASTARHITVDRELLANAVRRVGLVSRERVRPVKLAIADGVISLTVRNTESGQAVEEVECGYDGEPFDVGLNSTYLLDALGQTAAETLRLGIDDAASPMRIETPPDDPEHGSCLAIVMPLRI